MENKAILALLIKSDFFHKKLFLENCGPLISESNIIDVCLCGILKENVYKNNPHIYQFQNNIHRCAIQESLKNLFVGLHKKRKKKGGNACISEHGGYIQLNITLSLLSDFEVCFFDKLIIFQEKGCLAFCYVRKNNHCITVVFVLQGLTMGYDSLTLSTFFLVFVHCPIKKIHNVSEADSASIFRQRST